MNEKPQLLVIDDELSKSLEIYIKSLGYNVTVTDSAIKGLELFNKRENKFDVIILDKKMPGMDGLKFLDSFGTNKETAVIMLTAFDERKLAVDAMKKGAFDFVSKDEATMVLDEKIKRAYEHVSMMKKINEGHKQLSEFLNFERIIQKGRDASSILKEIIRVVDDIVPHEILITAILEDKSDHYQVVECMPEKHKKILLSRIQIEREFLDSIEMTEGGIKILRRDQIENEPILMAMKNQKGFNAKSAIIIPLHFMANRMGFIIIHTNSTEIDLTYYEREYIGYYGTQAAEIVKILKLIKQITKHQTYKFNKGLIHELSEFPFILEKGILGNSEEDKKDALKELERFRDLIGELKATCSGIENKFNFKKISLASPIESIVNYIDRKNREFSSNKTAKKVILRRNFKNDIDIVADQSKLYLALKVITDNGLRAIHQDKTKPEGELVINCYNENKYRIIKISDNGIGMDKELIGKIFDPFLSGDNGGWGVGLAFARDIIEEHDGYITVESEPGVGSHFFVHIPIAEE